MKRHAKASPVRSTECSGKSRGIVRRAGAIRGCTRRSEGSSASSAGLRGLLALLALSLCALGITAAPAMAATPTVEIDAPSEVSYTSAHLSGHIDPEGTETYWEFEISTDGFNWSGFNFVNPPIFAEQDVSMDLSNLEDGVTYFVRLSAFNEGIQYFSAEPNPEFTTKDLPDPVVSIDAPSAVTATSAHFSGTINPEAPAGNPPESDVSWHFECSPECPGLTGGTVPAGSSPQTVEDDTTGLKPGVEYQVTLYALNASDSVSAGPESFTTPPVPAGISAVSATPKYTEATVRGTIDPGGADTTYRFDYGTTSAYGQSTPTQIVPAGNDPVKVSATILGLTEATGYHYRLVTSNSAGEEESGDRTFNTVSKATAPESCPNAAIRTEQGSAHLPECRAYELVNPPGSDVGDVVRALIASDDGEHVAWASPVAPEGAQGARVNYNAVANRGASGWTSADANPVAGEQASQDTTSHPAAFSDDLSKVLFNSYVANDPADKNFQQDYYHIDIGTHVAQWVTKPDFGALVGTSDDLSRVVFAVRIDNLFGPHLLRWDEVEGIQEVVPAPPGAYPTEWPSSPVWNPAGEGLPDITVAHGGAHTVSEDGSRVFFYESNPTGGDGAEISMKDFDTEITTSVTASHRTGEVGVPQRAYFLGASPDGSFAYVQTRVPLTDEAAPNGGIYRVAIDDEDIALISTAYADLPTNSFDGGRRAVMSDDASHLYFVSSDAVLPGAEEDAANIYMWSQGGLALVASVNGEAHVERASANGRYLAFSSNMDVEGSSNDGHLAIFEYDAVSGEVTCATCRPDGSPSEADASLEAQPFAQGVAARFRRPRSISDNGHLFFTSTDRILPEDRTTARDVYMYHDGKLSLLTEGRGDENSYVAESSDDGRDVFILTRSPLLAEDQDAGDADMYDLRIDGGFPSASVGSGQECQGEACQGPGAAAPALNAPASSNVSGQGNVKPKKAKRHKKKHHRKHHKKGGRNKQKHANHNRRAGR